MPLKTLIVDDEPIARQVLREALESIRDVEVVGEADNGAAALEEIRRRRPDLVLVDLQMPLMGGLDVVRNLKRGTHVPVIVIVTAYDSYAIPAATPAATGSVVPFLGSRGSECSAVSE
jgi:two-component system LytT family response regulator